MKRLLVALAFIFLLPIFAYGQTPVAPYINAHVQLSDQNGVPLAGGFVYTYISGTNTQQPTYTDSTGTVQNTNPIVLDATGSANIWLVPTDVYRFTVQNSAHVQQWTIDGINWPATGGGGITQVTGISPIVVTNNTTTPIVSCPTCAQGTIAKALQYSPTYYTAPGSNNILGGLSPPTTPGVWQLVWVTGGGGAVAPTFQVSKLECLPGLGDGNNAIAAATYSQFNCLNLSGASWTIVGISCYTDNAGSSTLDATNNAGTDLLTGPITCNNTKSGGGQAGTQSATTTIAVNDAVNFSFVSDGTTKTTTWTVLFHQ